MLGAKPEVLLKIGMTRNGGAVEARLAKGAEMDTLKVKIYHQTPWSGLPAALPQRELGRSAPPRLYFIEDEFKALLLSGVGSLFAEAMYVQTRCGWSAHRLE